jgi:hypothetical protein
VLPSLRTLHIVLKRKLLHCIVQVFACIFFALPVSVFSQENVGIGTTTPDSSAVLELSIQDLSRPKGILLPRVTTAQRDAIILPAYTLLIFNTTTSRYEYNVGTPQLPLWTALGVDGGAEWQLTGNENTDPSLNFLGTTDATDLIFKTDGSERLRITSDGNLLLKSEATASELRFFAPYGSGLYYTGFKAGLQGTNITYTLPLEQGDTGTVLRNDGNGVLSWSPAGAGSVTSIGLALPDIFDVDNSPITSAGTITASLVPQDNHTFFAGPLSAPGIPAFRTIDTADLPDLYMGMLNGILPVSKGGTGVSSITGILTGNGTSEFVGRTITGTANQITVTDGNGATANPNIAIATNPILPGNASTTGTFTAGTGLTVSAGGATIVSGGLTVSAGTTTLTPLSTGIVHSSSTGVLSSSPINLANTDVTGTLPVSNGGTGVTSVTGILAGNGTAPIAGRTITGTANQISVTDGNGAVANPTIAIASDPVLPGVGATTTPSGTTAQRPASPVNGMMRYNTETGKFEFYQNGEWVNPLGSTLNGSGTPNVVPKFTSSTNLGNSNISDNGTSVGFKNTSPHASALIDMTATNQGFLPPRMTNAQRDAIASPAEGLTVYVTDSTSESYPKGIYYYDGAAWRRYVRFVTPTSEASMRVLSKTTQQQITGTSTPVNDNALSLPVTAGERWIVDAVVLITVTGSSLGEVNFKFNIPTGATLDGGYHVNAGSNVSSFSAGGITNTTQYNFQIINNTVTHVLLVKFVVTSPTNSGNIVFACAPSNSSNTVTVKTGSYFIAARGSQ